MMTMRLTTNNIEFVKRQEWLDGVVTYGWYVAMKGCGVGDSHSYFNYENGRTVMKEYPFEALPISVQKFICSHEQSVCYEDDKITVYIYK